MKGWKKSGLFLLLVMVVLLFPMGGKQVVAETLTTEDGTYEYQVLANGTVEIINYKGAENAKLSIPSEIDGKTVTSIGSSAFQGCNGLTGNLTIPDSVTSIGSQAFSGCSGLTGSLTIPNSVTSIGSGVFSGCSGLTGSLTIPNSVTSINSCAFSYCSGLTGITIPNSVTSIGSQAFSGCSGLTGNLTIPNGVKSIDSNAFSGCSGLTGITIPNRVTSIGNCAFSNCSGLTEITIPNSVTSIGSDAFQGCSGLEIIKVDIENQVYDSRNNCNAIIETNNNCLIQGCKTTIIPEGVTSIGSRAFSNCSGLTGITIPNSVTSIGSQAFSGCSGLEIIKVDIENQVYDSRNNCNAIIETNNNRLILGCKTTIIPEGVTSIYSYAFSGCSGLTEITIPNGIKVIWKSAFYNCSGLMKITISNSVVNIDYRSFDNCSGLEIIKVDIENQVYDSRNNCNAIIKTNNNCLIQGCKTTIIPEGVTSIGSYAFYNCSGLTEITIPNSVTSIDSDAFRGCSGLEIIKVDIENQVYDSRNNCNAIVKTNNNCLILGCKTTIIPEGVTSIGSRAFYNCSGLTEITIPNSVTSIGSDAFYNCSGLTEITIPNSVTSIGNSAFSGCSGLTEITIPNSIKSIGFLVFSYCSGLTRITIPNSVTSIDSFALSGCSRLTIFCYKDSYAHTVARGSIFPYQLLDEEVPPEPDPEPEVENGFQYQILENGTVEIVGYLGSDKEVTIPDKIKENAVTAIGDEAFKDCVSIEKLTILEHVTDIGENAFSGCEKLTIYCKNNSAAHTYADENNIPHQLLDEEVPPEPEPNPNPEPEEEGDFQYQILENGTVKIVGYLGSDKEVTIPDRIKEKAVTAIGDEAFKDCVSIEKLTILEHVTDIGENAFSGCEKLTIYCKKNSTAHTYADENGISHQLLDEDVPPEPEPEPEPDPKPVEIHHIFFDYTHQNPVTGSAVTIYGNGTTARKVGDTTINNKQATLFTDILASYQYTKNNKGKVTPSTGKVIVGIAMSDSKPTLTKNKMVDTAAAKIAKATIKNGIVTVTAAGKGNGTVYLWVIDTGKKGTCACIPITVNMAPQKVVVQDSKGTTLKKAEVKNGASLSVEVSGISGTLKANGCTYTATVDSSSNSYLTVTPIAGTNQFTITGKGLKNDKDTKASVIFTCDQNGKKVKFSVTIKK